MTAGRAPGGAHGHPGDAGRDGVLAVRHSAWVGMLAHLRGCLPREGCGFLAGRGMIAERFLPGRNEARGGRRFFLGADAVRGAFMDARGRGLRLLGVVHSHPRGRHASGEDVPGWPGMASLVIALSDGSAAARRNGKDLFLQVRARGASRPRNRS